MPPELEDSQTKTYSEEEITKILNTAKATRAERDEAAKKAKELETQLAETTKQLEQIKGVDPKRYQELETLAKTYEERKLEEQREFGELKERWQSERTTLQQQNQQLQNELKTTRVINALEKAFYAVGGKAGSEGDLSYFDLLRDRAMQYIEVDETGKLAIIDPRDKTRMVTDKGTPYTVEDLMTKFRTAGPTTSLFEPIGNGAGGGMQRSNGSAGSAVTREQLMKLPRAERLAKARELGI
ncbi:hypothetical protein [Aulosira sp. FACHB-615]|uniref:hypothetical protein n=1 Tax=Aulosira sp. FACHB-615 TaxID=2692777 RepID=UPI001682B077|nr:hypothetical protein [Aulosira sp. FACHB-615]MBD2489000.1 hypothetical protein [Aulosira sp. FACHB-615]